jgi:hypothetical protein
VVVLLVVIHLTLVLLLELLTQAAVVLELVETQQSVQTAVAV